MDDEYGGGLLRFNGTMDAGGTNIITGEWKINVEPSNDEKKPEIKRKKQIPTSFQ